MLSAYHRSISSASRAAQAAIVGDIAGIAGVAEVEMPRVHVVELIIGPLKIPEHNILARRWSKDDKKANEVLTSAQHKEQFTEAVKNEANNLRRKRNEKIAIRYAKDTHLNFPELPGQHLDDELKRVADVLLCKGPLHHPYIREILYKKPAVNHANYEHRLKLAKRSVNAQYHTTKYARRRFTCDKIVNQQKFWRSIYIGTIITAIDTVVYAESGTTAEKSVAEKALFSYWRTCKTSSSFDQHDLGTAADVISRASRAAGDTRRAAGHERLESVHVDIVD
ncbi:hypothetical protein LTR87_012107 [Friedmanniomyces endolithicus]|nr:hypothetical protein LTR87_012107 [Friedmanniomyces endolithicus]